MKFARLRLSNFPGAKPEDSGYDVALASSSVRSTGHWGAYSYKQIISIHA